VLVAACAALAWLLTRPETAVLPRHGNPAPRTGELAVGSRESAATGLLARLTAGLEHGSRRQVLTLALPGDPAARRQLGAIFDNVRALHVTGLSMRYVDEDAARLTDRQESRLHGHGWVGDVAIGWRIAGYDQGRSSMEVTLTLARTTGGAAFVSARGRYGDPAPLWLLDRLTVRRSPRALVMVADPSRAGSLFRTADQAVLDVKKVLPGWRGKLVVEMPATETDLNQMLQADPHTYDNIAAVTTTVDGRMTRSAPTHIFVNPQVFDRLGPEGSQIVISHEATHVATHADLSSMPTWLLEGFADYVALDHVDLPVSVTASQILAEVRKNGPPDHLPTAADFDPQNQVLGATYESAWLACRLLAQEYGEQNLIAFYEESDRDSSTEHAFRDVLHTDKQTFTRSWEDYLRQLASGP
jgi:hypothetical protein